VIYFLCHPDAENYQWDVVPLAEGLSELGVPYCSSADYWMKPDGGYLLPKNPDFDPLSADAVVVSSGFLKWVKDDGQCEFGELPEWILKRPHGCRSKFVALDVSDGYLGPATTKWSAKFDLILRAQYNRRMWWNPNVRPWAFGLTQRIVESSRDVCRPWSERSGCVFAFGASHGYDHGSREWARRHLLAGFKALIGVDDSQDDLSVAPQNPRDALLWKQCLHRHSPSFFRRLGGAKACAAFCGELVPGMPKKVNFLVGGNRARAKRRFWECCSSALGLFPRNVQPDSWRFWEALACGTAVIHFDTKQTGWEMPVMPENWKHYIGVDVRRPAEALERLREEPEVLGRVARDGRNWALEHYAPKAVAGRFLETLA
jgi:hypothetical protein